MRSNKTPGPALLTTKQAAIYLALSSSTLEGYRTYGGGPVVTRFGRAVRYLISDLDDWSRKHRRV